MSESIGKLPWRPVISMGDGRGGYGTARHESRKRVLGTIAGHECVLSVMGDSVYDRDGHGTWYLCGYVSDADALSRWRGWLRSQGVDA